MNGQLSSLAVADVVARECAPQHQVHGVCAGSFGSFRVSLRVLIVLTASLDMLRSAWQFLQVLRTQMLSQAFGPEALTQSTIYLNA